MNLFRTSSLALVAVLAVGCSDPAGPSAPDSGTAESPPSMSAPAPSMEPTGPEAPRSGDDGVAISIPQLPIGGGGDPEGAAKQCVTVSWLQSGLSLGPGVRVTAIGFSDPGVFRAGGGCGGAEACTGFTFHANGDTCSVAVTALGTGRKTRLKVAGKAACSCPELRSRVEPNSIPLRQPDGPSEPESPTPETPTSETTASG
jgi:hypothetical protein